MNPVNNEVVNATISAAIFMITCITLPPLFIYKSLKSFITRVRPSEDMKRKVVLITGASSGIGEYMAYEYAKKGACLVLVARREGRLREAEAKARELGSPDVLILCADVSNIDACKTFVDEAVSHFGRLDHIVNNAGIANFYSVGYDITKVAPVMDINFWGSVYPTHFAIPHLRKTRGKIIVNASIAAFLHPRKQGFYSASKAALISFYESLRLELPEIAITVVTLGYVESEMTQGKYLSRDGELKVDERTRKAVVLPLMNTEPCAKAIVDGACRGDRYITQPQFYSALVLLKFFFPEIFEYVYMQRPKPRKD